MLLLGFAVASPAHAQSERAQLNVKIDAGVAPAMKMAQQDGVVLTGISSVDRLNRQYEATRMTRIFRPAGKFEARHRQWGLDRWYRIEIAPTADAESAARAYLSDPAVEAASPVREKALHGAPTFDLSTINGPTRAAAERMGAAPPFIPDDPLYGDQWHYDNTGQTNIPEDGETGTPGVDVNLPEAHDIQTGSSDVIVSIVDSGLDLDHPDFQGALWINDGEDINGNGVFDRTPAAEGGDLNGVDDDGNGFVDDVVGYDFADNDPIPDTPNPGVIDNSHGTHVAGTVGARNNNGTGVAGVAGGDGTPESGVRLMITQTFSTTVDGFAEAIVYAADNGAVISNNSWGYTSPGVFEQPVLDAIDYFVANAGGAGAPIDGGIFVTSAGNSDSSAEFYPGFYSPSFNVSSTEDTDTKSSFSNFGSHVDVAAPGGQFGIDGVISTLHTSQQGGYGSFSGTSMAAPHIAGAAALIASEMPGMTAAQVEALLANSGVDISDLNPGFELGRRLDAFNALQGPDDIAPATVSDLAIQTPALQAVGTSVTLTWTAPGDDGTTGTASRYDLRYSDAGPITDANFDSATPVENVPAPQEAGTAESFTIEGLPFETELWFALRTSDEFLNTSGVSNSPSIVTEQGPDFTLSVDSVGTSLLIGETGSASFSVTNTGTEDLDVQFFGFAALELLRQPGIQTNNVSAPAGSSDHAKGSDAADNIGYPVLLGAGGPDDFGYNWIDSNEDGGPTFDWIDISGDGTPVSAGDESVTTVTLPFDFSFYGETYTDVGIGSNGYLVFEGNASDFSNNAIPDAAPPNAIVAPFWDDLNPSDAGTIYTRYDEAEDRFIVQYDGVAKFASPNRYTFQVILYGDGSILFQYETMDAADSATIGVENATGSDGLQVVFNAPYVEDGLAVAIQTTPTYLTLSPTSTLLSGGSSETFTVGFDASDLAQGLYDYTLRGTAANASASASIALRTGLDVTGAPFPLELSLSEINESLDADASVNRTLTVTNPTMREQSFRLELRGMSGIAPTYEPRLKGEERIKYERMAESLKKLAGTSRADIGAATGSPGAPALDFLPQPMAELNLDGYSTSVFGDQSGQFVRFDLGDPESLFALDNSPTIFAGDFAVGQQDRFYVITNDDNAFHSITTGGSITTFGLSEPVSSGETWTELASNPVDGTLYGSTSDGSASYIYTIDPASGEATRVAQVAAPVLISIAIDEFGQMYGLEIVNDVLLRIDKATGEAETIGSVGFDANFAQGMDYDLATGRLYMAAYNNVGAGRGELRIADTDTGETTLVGLLGSGDELGYLALNSVGFVRSNLLGGTIAPQNSVDLDLLITAEGLYEGTYTGELAVISDVPGEPAEEVMVTLTVDADGALTLDETALTYDALFIGNDQTQSVLVSNTGRAPIDLSLSIDNADFTLADAANGAFTLPAGVSREVEVTFAPTSVGAISGTLTVDGAPGGAQTVALSGEGVPAPEVELSPAAFDLQAYPGQTYTRTLTMTNTGGSPLEFSSTETVVSEPGASVAPSAVFTEVIMEEDFDSGIPSDWSVVDNTTGGVVWQTNDDYGRGNFAGTGGAAAADSDEAGAGVPYDTELITPEMTGIDGLVLRFLVNFQAIGTDNFFDVDVTTDGGATWTNVLQLVDDTPAGGLFVPNSGVQQTIPLQSIVSEGETFQARFRYYTPDPEPFDWYAQIDDVQIAQQFEYVTYAPASGTVQPGESLELVYSIDATGLAGGAYQVDYTFTTNAPATPSATVPFTLNVIEELAVTPDPQVGDDGIVHPNEEFTVPVLVESLDDLAVKSYELTLAFDGSVVEPVAVETAGTLSDGLVLVSNLGDDTVQIAAAESAMASANGATPVLFDIEGEGTLVNVTFRAQEVLGTTDITASEIVFNEGQPAASGGTAPVEVAPLYGDASLNVMVNGQDAAIVLQHAADLLTLDGAAFVSADVTGDGTVGAFDAALILQYASEMITCFPVDESCETAPALASKSGGSAASLTWGTPAFDPAAKSSTSEQALSLPLTLNRGSEPVYAFEVAATLDASLRLDAVTTTLPDGWTLMHRAADDGTVTIAAAGLRPLPAGTVASLDLAWSTPDQPLTLSGSAVVNEAAAKSMAEAELMPRPEEFALRGNYPNPFGTTTRIAMDLPADATVDLEVYDLLGRRVQSIRGTSLSAGADRTIQINGSRLSAGVYFYRLTVQMGDEKQTDTGRMTVVR